MVTVAIGVVSGKVLAVLIGPAGVGKLALLSTLIGLGSVIAGVSVGPGLVRSIAAAISRDEPRSSDAFRRAGLLIGVASGTLTAGALALLSAPVSSWVLGDPSLAPTIVVLALAIPLSVAAMTCTSILNGYHRVSALARTSVLSSVLGASASIGFVTAFGESGIAPSLVVASACALLVTALSVRRSIPRSPSRAPAPMVREAVLSLSRFGLPYTASVLAGSSVQLLLPIFVLTALDTQHVGFYRAATAISVGYVAFLLSALGRDFYPRIAASVAGQVVVTIDQQQRLTMLLGIPILMAGLAMAPLIMPLLYTDEFRPAVDLLEWQLTGDLLRLPSWVFGFALLARGSSGAYLANEVFAGVVALTAGTIGLALAGLDGLGLAYVFTYLAYYAVVWLSLRRYASVRPTEPALLAAAVLGALCVRIFSDVVPDTTVRLALGAVVALVVSTAVVSILLPKVRGVRRSTPG